MLLLEFQHVFKDHGGQDEGDRHDPQHQVEDGPPAEGVDHQSGYGGGDDGRGGGGQAVGSHHGPPFLRGVHREDDHLGGGEQDPVAAGLDHPAGHHHAEVPGKDAQQQPDQEAGDPRHVQPFGGEAGDEEGRQGLAGAIAVGTGQARGADAEVGHQVGQGGGHRRGQGGGGQAGDHQVDKDQGTFFRGELGWVTALHGGPPFCAAPRG